MADKSCQICRVCGNHSKHVNNGTILDICIEYSECDLCGYVQTEPPYWLDRAYNNAINISDTGIVKRNIKNATVTLSTLSILHLMNNTVVDYAGGYGILVRMLRDYGIEALWSDPYCENLLSKGFEYSNGSASLVTAFEVFEHFEHPTTKFGELLTIAPNVLISTTVIPEPTPSPDSWHYYGQDHGQHIGFFRVKTLELMARKAGKYFASDGMDYHLFSDKPVSKFIWRKIVRFSKLAPIILKSRLVSKTLDDQMAMVNITSTKKVILLIESPTTTNDGGN